MYRISRIECRNKKKLKNVPIKNEKKIEKKYNIIILYYMVESARYSPRTYKHYVQIIIIRYTNKVQYGIYKMFYLVALMELAINAH